MVPEDWKHLRLSEICTIVTSGSRDWAQYYADDGAKFIRMTNLRRGSIWLDLSDLKFVDIQSDSSDGKRTSLRTGDILMSITAELGKIGWVHEGLGEAYINQHTALIRLNQDQSSTMFVAYLLSSQEMNSKINRLNDSGAKAGLNLPTIRSILLGLPPLPEQKKIAQILSTWDKAITTTEQLLANSQQQKKALMQQLLTGKKRLLDKNGVRFSGEWRFIAFDSIFKVNNKKSAQVKSSDYLETGAVPVVDQGKQLIVGYCNNEERYTDVPAIIFGDHTRCLKWIDFEFCPGADGTQVLDTKAGINKKFGYYLLCFTDIPNLGYSRHMRELKEKDFKVPLNIAEQQKIATVLSTADQEISALQQKLDALKQEKKALMQQLLTGKRRVKVDSTGNSGAIASLFYN